MSADLFALFGDLSQTTPPPQKQHSQPTENTSNVISSVPAAVPAPAPAPAPANSDPFSFLASGSSAPQPQSSQSPIPWPPLQQATTAQPSPWLTSPVKETQLSNAWGDIGGLGGQGASQSQPTSFPILQEPSQVDDDGWGDFEVASPAPLPQPPVPVPSTAPAPARARVTRALTFDMMTNKLLDLDLGASTPEPWQQRPSWEQGDAAQPPPKLARNPDPNVLFDADFEVENGAEDDDDDDDDDDFGDFETGTPAPVIPQVVPASSALDLLSLNPTPAPPLAAPKKQPPGLTLSNAALQTNPSCYPEAPKSPYGSFHDRKPSQVKQLQVKPPAAAKIFRDANEASPSPVTAWPSVEPDGFGNKWEEFKDLPDKELKPAAAKSRPKPTAKPAPTSTPAPPPDWEWQDWAATEDQPAAATTTSQPALTEAKPGPPPTNIPPPATLLSLFPHLLDLASSTLLKPLLTLAPSSPAYQRVISSEPTLTFLRGYLALATVAARLIAGRKQRWHRDKFLAQGMAISAAGPAAAGQRGMKLASVDKSQAVHEDREAAEVVAVWKRQVGRLRGVVAGVNAAHQGQGAGLKLPEVAVGLAVSTAKGVPTAPRACVVCGLKRDERVAKVDVEVEDSFGEWWVEFWGHRECRNFWVEHERELRTR